MATREKFATKLDSEVIVKTKERALRDGTQIQFVVETALRRYLAEDQAQPSSNELMEFYGESVRKYGAVYKKLAE